MGVEEVTSIMLETLLPPLQRWLLFSGVLLLVGAVTWRSFVGPWQPSPLRPAMREVEERLARAAFWVTLFLVPVWLMRLQVQVMGFRDPFAPLLEDLRFLILDTFWGTVWIGQGVILLGLAGVFRRVEGRARRKGASERQGREAGIPEEEGPNPRTPPVWRAAWCGVALLVLTLSLSSHAMSVPLIGPLAVTVDGLHTLAAGAWMGTLALILLLSPRGNAPAPVLAGQLRSFSYLAMGAVPVLLLMGTLLSGVHLGELQNLWASGYGRVLSLKILLAGIVLFLGFQNWRHGLPVVDDPEGSRLVRRRATLEVGTAVMVVLLTAILVGMSMPEGAH